jgi:hypothetical protein
MHLAQIESLAVQVLVLALVLGAPAALAGVRAFVDHPEIAAGDTLELTLELDGAATDEPDLEPLKADFDIVSSARSTNVQITSGAVSTGTAFAVTLTPKRNGVLTIPALVWGNTRSTPLRVTVRAGPDQTGANGNSSANSSVFIETSVDSTKPYVQAAVNLVVRLYAAEPLVRASMEIPATSDLLVQQLGSDKTDSVERDGRRYQRTERHYTVFPQRSGLIDVPGVQLEAQVPLRAQSAPFANQTFADLWGRFAFGSLMGRMKSMRVHGDPIVLNVRSRPQDAYPKYWVPARAVTLTGDWRPESNRAQAGDPLTVTLHLEAVGLTAAQLPDLASLLELPAGVKAYADQARLATTARTDAVVGRRDQSIALIADRPGEFSLPAIKVHWWDTTTDSARETELPASLLTFVAPEGTTAPNASAETGSGAATASHAEPSLNSLGSAPAAVWRAGFLGVTALWIATLIAWAITRRPQRAAATALGSRRDAASGAGGKATAPSNAARAWAEFRSASRVNDAPAAQRSLLAWAAARWPDGPPRGLHGLAARLGSESITKALRDLDRACYAGGPWQGAALLEAMGDLPAAPASRRPRDSGLAPLYD